jgi:hypothetical protein
MSMDWTSLREALEHRHSGTVAVGAAVAVVLWYTYAAGLTPEPPTLILAAAAVVAAFAFNRISDSLE